MQFCRLHIKTGPSKVGDVVTPPGPWPTTGTVFRGCSQQDLLKIIQTHRASVVACVTKYRGFRQRGPFEKSATVSPTSWRPHVAPAAQLRRRMGTAQSVSTLGDLEITRKLQSYASQSIAFHYTSKRDHY